jgi:Flp pilus assembly protein TadG
VIVELVIVLPVLLLMMMAIAEMGRALYQYDALTKAVRDGARYAASNALAGSLGTVDLNGVAAPTQNLVVFGNTAGTGSAVLPNLNTGSVLITNPADDLVSVEASYDYDPIFAPNLQTFGFGSTLDLTFTLQATVTMRAL